MKTIQEITRRLGKTPDFDASPVPGLGAAIVKGAGIAFAAYELGNIGLMALTTVKSRMRPKPIELTEVPKITIVMPAGEGMKSALRTILSQAFVQNNKSNIEIVVVDIRTRDESALIVKQLGSEFNMEIIELTKTTGGRFSQYSWGLEKAEGDIILLTGPSMRYSPFWVHNMVNHFTDSSGVVGVNGNIITPAGLVVGSGFASILRPVLNSPLTLGNCGVRKTAYANSEQFNHHLNDDLASAVRSEVRDFSRRLARNGKIVQSFSAQAFGSVELTRKPSRVSASIEPLVHVQPDKSNTDDYPVGG